MTRRLTIADVATLFRSAGLRRLLVVRLVGQTGDGLLNAGLAAYVLLDPARAQNVAELWWVLLTTALPYSILGPFAGVLLDRFSRRTLLTGGNVIRATGAAGLALLTGAGIVAVAGDGTGIGDTPAGFFVVLLIVTGINRFLLAGLSAALTHVVEPDELLLANATVPTLGTGALVLGGGIGAGIVVLIDGGYPYCLAAAAAAYAVAALACPRLGRLGPDTITRDLRERLAAVARGLIAAVRYVLARRPLVLALGVTGASRLVFGTLVVVAVTVPTVAVGWLLAGLAAGTLLAAATTPTAVARLGLRSAAVVAYACLIVAAVLIVVTALAKAPAGWFPVAYLLPAFLAGLGAQTVKIAVDTVLQRRSADAYRGRVFSLQDMIYNVAQITAAGIAALLVA